MYQGEGPRRKSSCQSMLFYCMDNIDKKHVHVVIWLLFRGSCRDPSFSCASNPILSRICKPYSSLACCHVFLCTFLTFSNKNLCACFRLCVWAVPVNICYSLFQSLFKSLLYSVYKKNMTTFWQLVQAPLVMIQNNSMSGSLLFPVCAYPSVVSYMHKVRCTHLTHRV